MRLLILGVFFLLVGCGRQPDPTESATSRGSLAAGAVACASPSDCSDQNDCVRFQVSDGGSFCAPKDKPCGLLSCESGYRCVCTLSLPGVCGCSPYYAAP